MIGFMDLCGTMWYHVTMWDPCSLAKLVSFTELTRVSGSQTSRFFIEVWTNKSFTGGGHLVRKKSFICKPPFLVKKNAFANLSRTPCLSFPSHVGSLAAFVDNLYMDLQFDREAPHTTAQVSWAGPPLHEDLGGFRSCQGAAGNVWWNWLVCIIVPVPSP